MEAPKFLRNVHHFHGIPKHWTNPKENTFSGPHLIEGCEQFCYFYVLLKRFKSVCRCSLAIISSFAYIACNPDYFPISLPMIPSGKLRYTRKIICLYFFLVPLVFQPQARSLEIYLIQYIPKRWFPKIVVPLNHPFEWDFP